MKYNLVICRFSEQRYMILILCTFFGTPGKGINFATNNVTSSFLVSISLLGTEMEYLIKILTFNSLIFR